MASTLSLPQRVVANDAFVYLTEQTANRLRWCPRLGACATDGGTATIAASGAFAIALDDTHAYVSGFGGTNPVAFCPQSSCGTTTLFNNSPVGPALDITTGPGTVFIPRRATSGQINACAAGTPCTTVVSNISPAVAPTAVLYHEGTLFWVEAGTSLLAGSVRGCLIAGMSCATMPPVTYANDATFSLGDTIHARIAADATHVYWTETGPQGRVRRAERKTPGSAELFAGDQPEPAGIVTDGAWVYWTTHFGRSVLGCPVAGCGGAPVVLATTPSNPLDIALAGEHLYVTTYGDAGPTGELLRIPK
jgi:hypothetical protein